MLINWFAKQKNLYSYNSVGIIFCEHKSYYQGFLTGFNSNNYVMVIIILMLVVLMYVVVKRFQLKDNEELKETFKLEDKTYLLNVVDENLRNNLLDEFKRREDVFVYDEYALMNEAIKLGFKKMVLNNHDEVYEEAIKYFDCVVLMSVKQHYDWKFDEIWQLKNNHYLFINEEDL